MKFKNYLRDICKMTKEQYNNRSDMIKLAIKEDWERYNEIENRERQIALEYIREYEDMVEEGYEGSYDDFLDMKYDEETAYDSLYDCGVPFFNGEPLGIGDD